MRIPDLSPREKDIESYLRDRIKKIGGKAYKFVSPANRSVPDRLILLPGGLILFVEVKRPKGRVTPGQEREMETIRGLGFNCLVVFSKPEVDILIGMIEDGTL